MARDDLHFRLRIPDDLKAQVEEAATKNKRSMTAEIVDRIEKSMSPDAFMEFMEMQLNATRSQLEHAKRQLRNRSMDDLVRNLQLGLSPALFDRLEQAAATNGRILEQELVAALEAAYPPPKPFSLDWFRNEWLAKILAAPAEEREPLIDQANQILAQHGGFFEIWYSQPLGRDDAGEVVLSMKNRDERDPGAEYGSDDE